MAALGPCAQIARNFLALALLLLANGGSTGARPGPAGWGPRGPALGSGPATGARGLLYNTPVDPSRSFDGSEPQKVFRTPKKKGWNHHTWDDMHDTKELAGWARKNVRKEDREHVPKSKGHRVPLKPPQMFDVYLRAVEKIEQEKLAREHRKARVIQRKDRHDRLKGERISSRKLPPTIRNYVVSRGTPTRPARTQILPWKDMDNVPKPWETREAGGVDYDPALGWGSDDGGEDDLGNVRGQALERMLAKVRGGWRPDVVTRGVAGSGLPGEAGPRGLPGVGGGHPGDGAGHGDFEAEAHLEEEHAEEGHHDEQVEGDHEEEQVEGHDEEEHEEEGAAGHEEQVEGHHEEEHEEEGAAGHEEQVEGHHEEEERAADAEEGTHEEHEEEGAAGHEEGGGNHGEHEKATEEETGGHEEDEGGHGDGHEEDHEEAPRHRDSGEDDYGHDAGAGEDPLGGEPDGEDGGHDPEEAAEEAGHSGGDHDEAEHEEGGRRGEGGAGADEGEEGSTDHVPGQEW